MYSRLVGPDADLRLRRKTCPHREWASKDGRRPRSLKQQKRRAAPGKRRLRPRARRRCPGAASGRPRRYTRQKKTPVRARYDPEPPSRRRKKKQPQNPRKKKILEGLTSQGKKGGSVVMRTKTLVCGLLDSKSKTKMAIPWGRGGVRRIRQYPKSNSRVLGLRAGLQLRGGIGVPNALSITILGKGGVPTSLLAGTPSSREMRTPISASEVAKRVQKKGMPGGLPEQKGGGLRAEEVLGRQKKEKRIVPDESKLGVLEDCFRSTCRQRARQEKMHSRSVLSDLLGHHDLAAAHIATP